MSRNRPKNNLDLDSQLSVNFLVAVAEDAYKEEAFLFGNLFVDMAYELMDEWDFRPGTNHFVEC